MVSSFWSLWECREGIKKAVSCKFEPSLANIYESLIIPCWLEYSFVDFDYAIQLPPAANEMATNAYMTALASMYYYLTVMALGTSGSNPDQPVCAAGSAYIKAQWNDFTLCIPNLRTNPATLTNPVPVSSDSPAIVGQCRICSCRRA